MREKKNNKKHVSKAGIAKNADQDKSSAQHIIFPSSRVNPTTKVSLPPTGLGQILFCCIYSDSMKTMNHLSLHWEKIKNKNILQTQEGNNDGMQT